MSSFDPYTQNLTLLMADGITQFNVSVSDVDSFYFYNQASCINYGAQAGASLLMLIILLVLAKESSRWKPIHLLNLLSLVFSFLRALLQALYFLTAWDEFYAQMSSDMSAVPRSAYANSITAEVIHILFTTSINLSLSLQAYTVFKSNGLANMYRYGLTVLSVIVTVLAIGFRFSYSIVICISIMNLQTTWHYAWLNTGCLATETITIWFYSLIFTGKLGHTLLVRKRQGWKQYTAVQVLAIMGGCTMVLPSIFAVLEYVSPDSFPEAGTIALTMVALLLPLSSIWAGMLTNSSLPSLNLSSQNSTGTNGSISVAQRKIFGSVSTGAPSSHLEFGRERKGSSVPFHSISPTTIDSVIDRSHSASSPARDSTEIDLENMGVRVDREFSVQSNRKVSAGYGPL